MRCPQCNTDNLPGSVFCEKCGFNLQSVPPTPSQGAACPRCGHINMAGAIFCDNCGASITGTAPTPPDSGGAPLHHPPITPPTPPPPITRSTPPQPVGDIICPSCNTPNPPGTLFCDKCGKKADANYRPLATKYPDGFQI